MFYLFAQTLMSSPKNDTQLFGQGQTCVLVRVVQVPIMTNTEAINEGDELFFFGPPKEMEEA